MTEIDESLSLLIHGGSKVGKSTIAGTVPKPAVIIDAEGSTKFLPLRRVRWDPIRERPPEADGSWDAAIVVVNRDWNVLQKAYEWLLSGQHQFKSVDLDSVTEVQRRLKEEIAGPGKSMADANPKNPFASWEQLLVRLDELVRGFRDLTDDPNNSIQVAVFTSESKMKDGKFSPKLQGSLADSLPFFFDVVGYVWMETVKDGAGQPIFDAERGKSEVVSRMITVSSNPLYEAGERVQGRLPDVVDNPNVEDMLNRIYDKTSKEKA